MFAFQNDVRGGTDALISKRDLARLFVVRSLTRTPDAPPGDVAAALAGDLARLFVARARLPDFPDRSGRSSSGARMQVETKRDVGRAGAEEAMRW